MQIYSEAEVLQYLTQLNDWHLKDGAIQRAFLFKDFNQALGFIVRVGLLAEQANHHPEIFNVYNKVVVRLNTHDAMAITSKDFELAKAIDHLG